MLCVLLLYSIVPEPGLAETRGSLSVSVNSHVVEEDFANLWHARSY